MSLYAYDLYPVVERLPRQIESLACYGENLLVGTKEGQLLVYSVQQKSESKFESILERSIKTFSKKPIIQIEAVPDYHFMVSLSDNVISVHDMLTFAPICVIEKTRGANYFALDLRKSEQENYELKLCVTIKRKLLFFHWFNRDFVEYTQDIICLDNPRMVVWFNEHIFVAFKKDYSFYNLIDRTSKDIFSAGSQLESFVLKCGDLVALNRDETSILVGEDGTPQQNMMTTWNYAPFQMIYDDPYLIALNQNCVEVRSFDPKLFIQQFELAKTKKICSNKLKRIYVASHSNIWRLQRKSNINQIKHLLENKEFELALTLTKTTDESNDDKAIRRERIKNLCAFELFSQRQYTQALNIFAELRTDPCHVVGLYPDLLPNVFRKQLQFPRPPPHLEGHDLELSLVSLAEYLKHKRNEIMKAGLNEYKSEISTMTMVDGQTVVRSNEQLAQIIDTTLLKCYLQTNDALVGPLLRLRDNKCYLKESERLLKLHNKIQDLITLYKSRGLHQKAFEVILQQSQRPQLNINWPNYSIEYLQDLDNSNLNVIFEYSEWLLKSCPDKALRIFTGDTDEAKSLPRNEVALYLQKINTSLLVSYLEHVINEWKDDTSFIHNMLAESYPIVIQPLLLEYIENLSPETRPCPGGKELGSLGILRKKFINFLEKSQIYNPEQVLQNLPAFLFFEEKAILNRKCGNYENGLIILIHILQDDMAAENYCLKVYDKLSPSTSQVFFYLFKAYLISPDFRFLSVGPPAKYSPFPKPNLPKAVEILKKHILFINHKKAIMMLPQTTLLHTLLDIFEAIFSKQASTRHESSVLRHLYESQHLKMKYKCFNSNLKCVISCEDVCEVCKKKISSSAFVRNVNGSVVHCFCHTKL